MAQQTVETTDRMLRDMLHIRQTFTKTLPEYSERFGIREGQIAMAENVWDTFVNNGHILIEAQTGVGKSNGYLVPAIMQAEKNRGKGEPVIISTGTKVLQDQLLKILPDLLTALKSKVSFTVLKGKSNYVCPYKYDKAKTKGDIPEWLHTRCKGAKEIDDLHLEGNQLDNFSYKVNVDDECLGRSCPKINICPMYAARNQAKKSDIIVTNHHVVMNHIKYPMAKILPDFKKVVFDEGHNLPGVISSVYTRSIAENRIVKLIKETRDYLGEEVSAVAEDLDHLEDATYLFFASIQPREGFSVNDPFLLDLKVFDTTQAKNMATFCNAVVTDKKGKPNKLVDIFAHEDETRNDPEAIGKMQKLTDKFLSLASDLNFICKQHSYFATWGSIRQPKHRNQSANKFLNYTPLDIGALYQKEFVKTGKSAVVTSATLGMGGKANYFKSLLGFDNTQDVPFLEFGSTFDYEINAMTYLPTGMLKPSDPKFTEESSKKVIDIVNMMNGRTLVLCTSLKSMKEMHDYVSRRVSFKCFMQGDLAVKDLIQKFKEDTHSVLFATKSLWEGVDIPGESLSCVILDKIPFPNQSDPIIKATSEYIESQLQNPFKKYNIPEAVILFKQGIGRLIRSETDKGLIVVLDPRVADSSYAEYFMGALPTTNIVRSIEEVEDWLKRTSIISVQ